MKIIILKDNIIEALNSVEKSVGSGNNLPILKSIKIKAEKNNQITFVSTNLELAVKHQVSGKVVDQGEAVIPFDLINSIIKNLNSEKVHLEYKDRKMNIKADNYEGSVNCDKPKEFPIIPNVKDKSQSLIIDSKKFKNVLDRVSTATQYSEIRPEINGVYINLSKDGLVFAGTDSFRLIEEKINLRDVDTDFDKLEMIIPLNTVESLLKILSNEGEVEVYTDSSQILFEEEDKFIISRLVDGSFPDYKNVIPKESSKELKVDREELINAVKLTKVFAGKANDISFKIPDNGKVLEIYSVSDTKGRNNYRVPVSMKGKKEKVEISFNWRYVLDGLRVYGNDEVTLGVNNSEKPITIRDNKDKQVVYILMPIRPTNM